jgi:hypothetical protein
MAGTGSEAHDGIPPCSRWRGQLKVGRASRSHANNLHMYVGSRGWPGSAGIFESGSNGLARLRQPMAKEVRLHDMAASGGDIPSPTM